MKLTLRSRVLLLVFLLNVLVFGAGAVYVFRKQVLDNKELEAEITDDLVATIRGTIRQGGLNVPRILRWPSWERFADALLIDRQVTVSAAGRVDPLGVALNPVGIRRRPFDFDQQGALAGILQAIRTQAPVDWVEGGRAVPISDPQGQAWGGIWFRTVERLDRAALIGSVLPWFALSTLILTLGTFFAMRRLVLDPVAQLAQGAGQMRAGDFSVRLAEPRRRDELADLVRTFNEMTGTVQSFNERLAEEVRIATEKARQAEAAAMTQRRLAAMGELAAGIAHEINNPLGGLENAVVSLQREDLGPDKRDEYLGLLARGLVRIGETVNRLRRFTPRAASHEAVDLLAVVRDALELVGHRADRLGVRMALDESGTGPLPAIEGARNEIGQAVLNLLANALDALEGEGGASGEPRIDLRLTAEHDGVTIVVRDNGPGVSADELERVSDLFYTTKQVGKGMGLGLALVHSTVAQHGGRLHITSEPGRFFQAELWFPLRRPEEQPESEDKMDRILELLKNRLV